MVATRYVERQLVPDYDLNWSEFAASEWRLHRDVDVESRLLDARFSFRWRPLYDASLVDEFERQLAGHHQPVLLLLGKRGLRPLTLLLSAFLFSPAGVTGYLNWNNHVCAESRNDPFHRPIEFTLNFLKLKNEINAVFTLY